jgi:hypothetical protein
LDCGSGVEVCACGAFATEDGESLLSGDDFTAGDAFWSMGPRIAVFGPVEEAGKDPEHVFPVAGVVSLEHEASAGLEGAVREEEEFRGDKAQSGLIAAVPWLGVVHMDFGD